MLGPSSFTHAQPIPVYSSPHQGVQLPRVQTPGSMEGVNFSQAGPVMTPHGWISNAPLEFPNTTNQNASYVTPSSVLHLIGAPPPTGGYYPLPSHHPEALYYIPHPTNLPPPTHLPISSQPDATQYPTGSTQYPTGSTQYPAGSTHYPAGSVSVMQPQGSMLLPPNFNPLPQVSADFHPGPANLPLQQQLNPMAPANGVNLFRHPAPSMESQSMPLAGWYCPSDAVNGPPTMVNPYVASVSQREGIRETNEEGGRLDAGSVEIQKSEEKPRENYHPRNIEISRPSSQRPACRTKVTVFKDVSVDTDFNDAIACKSLAELANTLFIEGLCAEEDACDQRTGNSEPMNSIHPSPTNDKGTTTSSYSDSGFSSPTRSSVSSVTGEVESSVIFSKASTCLTVGTSSCGVVVSGRSPAMITVTSEFGCGAGSSQISSNQSQMSSSSAPSAGIGTSSLMTSHVSEVSFGCQGLGVITAPAASGLGENAQASRQMSYSWGERVDSMIPTADQYNNSSSGEAFNVSESELACEQSTGSVSNSITRGSTMNVSAPNFISAQYTSSSHNLTLRPPTPANSNVIGLQSQQQSGVLTNSNTYSSAPANQAVLYSNIGGVYQQGPPMLMEQAYMQQMAGVRFTGPQFFLRFPVPTQPPPSQGMPSVPMGLAMAPPNMSEMTPGTVLSSQYLSLPPNMQTLPSGGTTIPMQYMVRPPPATSQSQQFISVPPVDPTRQSYLDPPPRVQYGFQPPVTGQQLSYASLPQEKNMSQVPLPLLTNNVQYNLSATKLENPPHGSLTYGASSFSGASGLGQASFCGATGPGQEMFSGATVPGQASFSGATVPGQASFSGTAMKVPLLNNPAEFTGQYAHNLAPFIPVRLGNGCVDRSPSARGGRSASSRIGQTPSQSGGRSSSRGRPAGRVEIDRGRKTGSIPAGVGAGYSRGVTGGGSTARVGGVEMGGGARDRVLPFLNDNEFPQLLSAAGGLVAQSDCLNSTAGAMTTVTLTTVATLTTTAAAMTYSDILKASSNCEVVGCWSGRSSLSGSDRTMSDRLRPGSCHSTLSPGHEGQIHHGSVNGGVREVKQARKKQKRQELADQAAHEELAEICLEQQVLRELGSKRFLKSATSGLLGSAPDPPSGAFNPGMLGRSPAMNQGYLPGPGATGSVNQGLAGYPPGTVTTGAYNPSFNQGLAGYPPGTDPTGTYNPSLNQGLAGYPPGTNPTGAYSQGLVGCPPGTGRGTPGQIGQPPGAMVESLHQGHQPEVGPVGSHGGMRKAGEKYAVLNVNHDIGQEDRMSSRGRSPLPFSLGTSFPPGTSLSPRRGARDIPRTKKCSSLKKVILKEREEQMKQKLQNGGGSDIEDEDDGEVDKEDLDRDGEILSLAKVVHEAGLGKSDGSGVSAVPATVPTPSSSGTAPVDVGSEEGEGAGSRSAEMSPVSQMSPMDMSPLSGSPAGSAGVSPIAGNGTLGSAYYNGISGGGVTNSLLSKIHSRRFREYCNQVLDKEIDDCCTLLLQDLVKFQDRLYHKDPTKAKSKRRFVLGLREVAKHLKLEKLKGVIISPNLERIQSKGGLDEALNTIIQMSQEQGVPFVFALGRRALGRACAKLVPVSVVGIFNYEGSEENFNRLISLTEKARQAYNEMISNLEGEMAAAMGNTSADHASSTTGPASSEAESMVSKPTPPISSTIGTIGGLEKLYPHMGHSRTPSACSAISFISSILSEPISENYPQSEPETDSRGYEIPPTSTEGVATKDGSGCEGEPVKEEAGSLVEREKGEGSEESKDLGGTDGRSTETEPLVKDSGKLAGDNTEVVGASVDVEDKTGGPKAPGSATQRVQGVGVTAEVCRKKLDPVGEEPVGDSLSERSSINHDKTSQGPLHKPGSTERSLDGSDRGHEADTEDESVDNEPRSRLVSRKRQTSGSQKKSSRSSRHRLRDSAGSSHESTRDRDAGTLDQNSDESKRESVSAVKREARGERSLKRDDVVPEDLCMTDNTNLLVVEGGGSMLPRSANKDRIVSWVEETKKYLAGEGEVAPDTSEEAGTGLEEEDEDEEGVAVESGSLDGVLDAVDDVVHSEGKKEGSRGRGNDYHGTIMKEGGSSDVRNDYDGKDHGSTIRASTSDTQQLSGSITSRVLQSERSNGPIEATVTSECDNENQSGARLHDDDDAARVVQDPTETEAGVVVVVGRGTPHQMCLSTGADTACIVQTTDGAAAVVDIQSGSPQASLLVSDGIDLPTYCSAAAAVKTYAAAANAAGDGAIQAAAVEAAMPGPAYAAAEASNRAAATAAVPSTTTAAAAEASAVAAATVTTATAGLSNTVAVATTADATAALSSTTAGSTADEAVTTANEPITTAAATASEATTTTAVANTSTTVAAIDNLYDAAIATTAADKVVATAAAANINSTAADKSGSTVNVSAAAAAAKTATASNTAAATTGADAMIAGGILGLKIQDGVSAADSPASVPLSQPKHSSPKPNRKTRKRRKAAAAAAKAAAAAADVEQVESCCGGEGTCEGDSQEGKGGTTSVYQCESGTYLDAMSGTSSSESDSCYEDTVEML